MQVPSLTLESLPRELAIGSAMCLGFIAVLFVLSMIVPGRKLEGAPLKRSGERITYTLNGFPIFLILVAAVGAGVGLHLFSLAPAIRHFWGLFIAANAFSFIVTGLLYVFGKRETPLDPKAKRGVVDVVRELFMGIELNPRFLGVDLKMFSYRPSLMGLFLLNVGHACVQYETYGKLSQGMIVYEALTFIYVFNYFQFEYGMLYTWDVMAENFGWMLVWGDYAFVPFAYCVIGWYLVDQTAPLPIYSLVGLPLLFVMGLLLFRGSNEQKERFKRNPQVKIWGRTAETMGGRILVSGFWGIGRKLNYTGEICIYFSWAGLSGTQSIVPYILPIWLFCLLTHRAWRDDKACRAKYGELWEQYCRRARFRMIPFVY